MLIFLLVNVGCPDLFLTMGVKRRPRGVEHKGVWSESVMTSLKMFWWPWFNNDGVGGSPQQKQQKQKPAETSATATLVRTIARQNAIVLRDRYAQQRTLATACRRKGVAAEAVAADLIRAEQRGFRRQMNESQVYMALHELRLMVWRATGTGADPGCECARQCAAAAAQELRGVLRYFESGAFDADSAAHLAALEALSEDAGASAGARCLAALQARTVRGICDATRQGDKAATRRDKAIERARAALQTQTEDDPEAHQRLEGTIESAVQRRMDRAFDLGYVDALWRGIEGRLPAGVAEARGKMPADMERVAFSFGMAASPPPERT